MKIGLLVLRLTLAALLIAHGAHRLFGLFAGPGIGAGGLSHTATYFSSMGGGAGLALAGLTGVIQLAAGLLLIVGFLTRMASLAAIGYLAIEMWKLQWRWGFFMNWTGAADRGHGIEFSLLLVGGLLCLVFAGAGDWSIDGQRANDAASRAAGRARVRRNT